MKSINNITLYILGGLIFLIVLYVGFNIYNGLNPFSSSEESARKYREELSVGWESRGLNSSVETLNAFAATLDEGLSDPRINQTGKKRLLLQKAATIATPRTLNPNTENLLEATSILRSVYESDAQSDTDVYLRNVTVPLFVGVLRGSCYLPAISVNLPTAYKALYDNMIQKGENPNSALILAFRDFSEKGIDPQYEDDKATVTGHAYLGAIYLTSFGGKNKTRDDEILRSMGSDVARYGSLQKVLMTSVLQGDVGPAQMYAFAFDIANTFGVTTVSKSLNAVIDKNYEQVYIEADKIEKDVNTLAIAKAINTFFYLESLHRRYTAQELDSTKVDSLVNLLIENISVSKETQKVFPGFLLAGQSESGKWMKVRTNFYEIAKKYPKLKEFLQQTAGISL